MIAVVSGAMVSFHTTKDKPDTYRSLEAVKFLAAHSVGIR
jgi:hypothetical protein